MERVRACIRGLYNVFFTYTIHINKIDGELIGIKEIYMGVRGGDCSLVWCGLKLILGAK